MNCIKNGKCEENAENSVNGEEVFLDNFFSKNPNPIIRAEKSGKIVCANSAASPLLESWGVREGEGLPLNIVNILQSSIIRKIPEKIDLETGGRRYLLTCYPLPEEASADLYGFDISSRKFDIGSQRLDIGSHKFDISNRRRVDESIKVLSLFPGELPEKEVWTRPDYQKSKELQHENAGSKRFENALMDNLRFLETMISTIPVAFFCKDMEGKYLGCNELFANQVLGLPKEKIVGQKLPELESTISPELARKVRRVDTGLFNKGGKHVFEIGITCSDGVPRTFLVSRAIFHDEIRDTSVLAGVMLDISGFKKTEITLRNSLNLFETLLDAIPAPIFYKNMEGVYLGCNDLFARKVAGVPKEKIINRTIYEMEHSIPEELIPIYEEYDRKLLAEGKPQSYVAKAMCANGELREFQFTKSFYNDASGKKLGIVVVMQDITELKKARDTLKTSEERYRIVTEQTGQVIFDYNIQTEDIDWAGAIPEITGYEAAEFRKFGKKTWQEHIHPEDREKAKKTILETLERGDKYVLEYRFGRKDGSFFHAEESGICLTYADGIPFRMLGVIKDVTESKMALKKLERSEERFRRFMEKFKGIAFQLDANFNLIFMHGSVKEISGYNKKDFLSGKVQWTEVTYSEDIPGVMEKLKIVEATPNTLVEHEFRITRPDGKTKWLHVIIQNIADSQGNFQYFQGTLYDISERKIAEEALEQTEIVRKKEIHHRIKNNLQVISSLLALQSDSFTDEAVIEAFRESQNRVVSMSLIHEELYKSRDMETIDFATYLRKLTSDLLKSYKVGTSDIRLRLDLEEISLGIDTSVPLGIIVNELVSNSLKHAFPEGGKGEIQIQLSRTPEALREVSTPGAGTGDENQHITLLVSDTGVGFPEQTDFRNTPSLGMQLVNTLVDQIDGNITLIRGKGTEFVIRFQE